jgi:hypothetical protein
MTAPGTISATFPTAATAEAAIVALLRTGFHGRDVILTKDRDARSYVVTVDAEDRVASVEDVLRKHKPLRWQTSIRDAIDAFGPEQAMLGVAPEDADDPWGPETEQASRRLPDTSAEADWLDQGNAIYPAESATAANRYD